MDKIARRMTEDWEALLDTKHSGYREGDCYMNAAKFVLEKRTLDDAPLILAHGDVTSPQTGEVHGHAWVEWGDGVGMVFDPSTGKPTANLFIIPFYYESGGIDEGSVDYFTADEIQHNILQHEVWGPWPQGG